VSVRDLFSETYMFGIVLISSYQFYISNSKSNFVNDHLIGTSGVNIATLDFLVNTLHHISIGYVVMNFSNICASKIYNADDCREVI
jgi:hypothetical protein